MSRSLSLTRRSFLAGAGTVAATSLTGLSRLALAAPAATPLTAEQVLARLIAGNKRFAAGSAQQSGRTLADIHKLAAGQNPIAAVLSCTDSRVSPEILFDQGLGDLFDVRIAGNYIMGSGAPVLGSLEYAVSQLNVPVVFVLGHTQCDTFKTTVEHLNDESLPGSMGALVAPLKPVVREARGTGDVLLADAIRLNVRRSVHSLGSNGDILPNRVKTGKLRIVGGIYDLSSGVVTMTA